jgi:hypothetical protein
MERQARSASLALARTIKPSWCRSKKAVGWDGKEKGREGEEGKGVGWVKT